MTRVLYPGSFDPVHNGHVEMVETASGLFDEVVVAVGIHPSKRYWFDADTRVSLIERSLATQSSVRVQSFEGLLVDLCDSVGAGVIVRGVRNAQDADYEMRYAMANRDLRGIETVMLTTSPEHAFVSSSIVKEIAGNGGDVSRYVPAAVVSALAERSA